MERLVSTMQDQIRILKKDLKEANEQIAAHKASIPPVAAMGAIPAPAAATAADAQPPPVAPARYIYQDYGEEPPFYHPPLRQMDRRPPRCFFCGGEGHFMSTCTVLAGLLRQQARTSAHAPPRGQILKLPPQEDDSHPNPIVQLNCWRGLLRPR